MLGGDVGLTLLAVLLVLLAGLFSAADAALGSFSSARAEELAGEQRAGAGHLVRILADRPRYLNTALLLRLACEVAAIVLATRQFFDLYDGRWAPTIATTIAAMLVISFVVIGVAPRTLGRQHAERMALLAAAPVSMVTTVLGPVPQLLILLGNTITPGRGFREGPFSTETELRELVDLAEQSAVIESGERRMIHSVFELGDTIAREVMVPRNDVVYIERYKNLRQARSLFLRSGFSRIPVIGENLDEVVGIAFFKDVARRDFEDDHAETTERIETVMRPTVFVPDSKPVDSLLRDMQSQRLHIAVVVDEYGGTAGLVTIEDVLEEIVGEITDEYDDASVEAKQIAEGVVRVPSRYQIDDLEELIGVEVEDEDVDSVGGLMAKHLGKVPIAGSSVEAQGLRMVAEGATGRRNRISAVLLSVIGSPERSDEVTGERSERPDYAEPHA